MQPPLTFGPSVLSFIRLLGSVHHRNLQDVCLLNQIRSDRDTSGKFGAVIFGSFRNGDSAAE